MNQLQPLKSPAKQSSGGPVNPFARALAETTETNASDGIQPTAPGLDAFRQALAKAHGKDPSAMANDGAGEFSEDYLQKQQEELRKQQERAQLRKQLHDRVNPIDNQVLFAARDKQVKDQIEQIRNQLKQASKPIEAAEPQIYATLRTELGTVKSGSYFSNYLHGLQERIKIFQKSVKDSGTWLHVGKKKRGLGQGNVSKNVQNTMWHENSNNGGAG